VKVVFGLAAILSASGWSLMLAVGILHSVGALSWTLSYDEAVALSALALLPTMLLLSVLVTAVNNAQQGPG
jgi:hypothetical protein